MHQELSTNQEVAEKNSAVTKLHHDNDAFDIDELMMQASKMVPQKSEDIVAGAKRHHVKKEQFNKSEKALLKKLKKL
jgi:hypothetical protein